MDIKPGPTERLAVIYHAPDVATLCVCLLCQPLYTFTYTAPPLPEKSLTIGSNREFDRLVARLSISSADGGYLGFGGPFY